MERLVSSRSNTTNVVGIIAYKNISERSLRVSPGVLLDERSVRSPSSPNLDFHTLYDPVKFVITKKPLMQGLLNGCEQQSVLGTPAQGFFQYLDLMREPFLLLDVFCQYLFDVRQCLLD